MFELLSNSLSVNIFSGGFLSVFLLAILRSRDNKSEGNNSKLASMANKSVIDTKTPKATVPPKLEIANTENPKNNTIEV